MGLFKNTKKDKKNDDQKILSKKSRALLVGGGFFIGFCGGFFGGGGGMLAVPLLNKGLKVKRKKSHATAMLSILPMSIAAAATYLAKGLVEVRPTIFSAVGVLVGGIIGALLLKKLNSFWVGLIFALSMIGIGIKLIFF